MWQDFLIDLVVKTPASPAGAWVLIPGPGNWVPHAMQQGKKKGKTQMEKQAEI